jgi:hypothetical protein
MGSFIAHGWVIAQRATAFALAVTLRAPSRNCHPERSEGYASIPPQIRVPHISPLRCGYGAQQSLPYLRRAPTADHNAPTPPTSASTAVGFSSESVHPVCACRGTAISNNSAHPMNLNVSLVIAILTQ